MRHGRIVEIAALTSGLEGRVTGGLQLLMPAVVASTIQDTDIDDPVV